MSLKIRLARAGTKKRPVYHIVIADSRAPRDGRYIERLGYFNPLMAKDNNDRLRLDLEKVKAWMAKGALPTDRVSRFLDEAGVMKRETRNNPEKAKPKADEFYHADLVGLTAQKQNGETVGTVKAIHNFGAGDLVEIEPAGGGATVMWPFDEATVPVVDLAGRKIVVEPPVDA